MKAWDWANTNPNVIFTNVGFSSANSEIDDYNRQMYKLMAAVYLYGLTQEARFKSHVEAIIDALEEERPPYDPRTMVNPEASKLFWGSEADKKLYSRKLRRAVQKSTED